MNRYEEVENELRKAIELEPENKRYVKYLDIVLHARKEENVRAGVISH